MSQAKAKSVRGSHTFEKLLNFLNRDRNEAWTRYQVLHERLTRYFDRHGCWSSQELADQTFDRMEDIDPERLLQVPAGKEEGFVINVGKNMLKEWSTQNSRQVSPVSAPTSSQSDTLVHELFDLCKNHLSDGDRHLLESYYEQISKETAEKSSSIRERIARQRGLSLQALRVRIRRIKLRLEAACHCCSACLEKLRN